MKKKFEPKILEFNKTANSSDFNEMNKEIGHDFYQTFKDLSNQKTMLNEVITQLKINNMNLIAQLDQLDKRTQHNNYISLYNSDNVSFGEVLDTEEITNKCFYSFNHGTATLGLKGRNLKTHLVNMDENIVVPNDLNVTIEDNIPSGEAEVYETDIYNAFDQKLKTSWIKQYFVDQNSSINSLDVKVNIDIPRSIITDMFVNSIYIDTMPERSVDITKIEYKPFNSNGYENINEFNQINSAGPTLISFPEKQMTALRITLEQTQDFQGHSSTQKMFPVGIKNCIVANDFYQNYSSLYLRYKSKYSVKIINDVVLDFANEVNEDSYDIKAYGVNLHDGKSLKEINIGEPISLNYNEEFYFKITLNDNFNPTPVLKGAYIEDEKIIK